MRRLVLVWALVPGCGRLGFEVGSDASATTSDADGAIIDAVIDASLERAQPCPTTLAFTDDFADGAVGGAWTTVVNGGITLNESQGALRSAYTTATQPDRYGAYFGTAGRDLIRACVTAHVTTLPAVGAYMFMTVGTFAMDDKLEIAIQQDTGEPSWWQSIAGTPTDLPYTSWQPGPTPWVRLQRASGELTLEASANGVDFYVLGRSAVTPFDAGNASVRIGGGTVGAVAMAGEVAWADISIFVP